MIDKGIGAGKRLRELRGDMLLLIKWALRHGVAHLYLRPKATEGDAHAQLWFDPLSAKDLPALQEDIRARGEIVRGRGGIVITSHGLARQIFGRPREFTSPNAGLLMPPWMQRIYSYVNTHSFADPFEPPSLVGFNGPELTHARALLRNRLSRQAADVLRPEIEARAETFSAELAHRHVDGRVDIVQHYARRLSQEILALAFEIDSSELSEVCVHAEKVSHLIDLGLTRRKFFELARSSAHLDQWTDRHIEQVRPGSGSVIASSVEAMRAGTISRDQLRRTVNLLLVAGYSTTISTLVSGISLLIENPDQLEILTHQPELWPNATEEVLRLAGPVMLVPRYCEAGAEVEGFRIKPQRPLYMTAMNRDPEQYRCPDRMDVTRANASTHFAFGGGPHRCLGSALARVEIEIGLRSFFSRWAGASITDAERGTAVLVRNWDELTVQLPHAEV